MKGERQVTMSSQNDKNKSVPKPHDGAGVMAGDRIAKVLARAGVASRREAERMILAGRVKVNGTILRTPAHTVTGDDEVLVDDVPIAEKEPPRVWRYHKPPGIMTTHNDPGGRPTVFENLPEGMPRVISIGRLDMNSEGLLLLTNDYELARQLELPSTAWARKYRARAYGRITQEELDTLSKGIVIEGIPTGPIEASLDKQQGDNAWISVTIREGKNREVRRALDSLGLKVNRLIRLAYGPFQLGTLGKHEVDEVQRRVLRDQVGHMVDIPKGRPTHEKTGPKTNKKADIKRAPRSAADARRIASGDVKIKTYTSISPTDPAAPPTKPARHVKKNNAKWGKEKSAEMRKLKEAETGIKSGKKPSSKGGKFKGNSTKTRSRK